MWIQIKLSCGKHCKAIQTGTVSRFWLCGRSWRFKILFGRNIVHFWKFFICSKSVGGVRNKLQFRTVPQNQKSFSWTQDWGCTVYPQLIYGIWDLIVAVLHGNTHQNNQERRDPCTNLVRAAPHTIQKTEEISWNDWWSRLRWFYFLERQFFSSGSFVVCVWRQRSSDQDDHEGNMPDNETCFQNRQSCSWLVVWQNQFGPQNPN